MIVDSLTKARTWYIFRDRGIEVEFTIGANHLKSTYELSRREIKEIEISILTGKASLVKVSPYEIKYRITTNGHNPKENTSLQRPGTYRS